MKPFERLTHRVSFRAGIIVIGAMMCLALTSASARRLGVGLLAATAVGVAVVTPAVAANNDTAIRPFRVDVPDADLADMKRRLATTRWPDQGTVADQSQGAQLAKLQALVRYWATDYDWRKAEARLNAFPQFKTTIDGSTFTSSTSVLVTSDFQPVRKPHFDIRLNRILPAIG